jgi:hypothetical protein
MTHLVAKLSPPRYDESPWLFRFHFIAFMFMGAGANWVAPTAFAQVRDGSHTHARISCDDPYSAAIYPTLSMHVSTL